MPAVRGLIIASLIAGRTTTYSYVIVQVGDDSMAVDPFRFNR